MSALKGVQKHEIKQSALREDRDAGSWVTFSLEGNLWWGKVDSREKWQECLEQYERFDAGGFDLRTARAHRDPRMPSCFGFYAEYTSDLTLGEWARRNSMYGRLFDGK